MAVLRNKKGFTRKRDWVQYVKVQRNYPTVGKTKNKKRSQKNSIDDIIFNFGEALGIVEADKNEQS